MFAPIRKPEIFSNYHSLRDVKTSKFYSFLNKSQPEAIVSSCLLTSKRNKIKFLDYRSSRGAIHREKPSRFLSCAYWKELPNEELNNMYQSGVYPRYFTILKKKVSLLHGKHLLSKILGLSQIMSLLQYLFLLSKLKAAKPQI